MTVIVKGGLPKWGGDASPNNNGEEYRLRYADLRKSFLQLYDLLAAALKLVDAWSRDPASSSADDPVTCMAALSLVAEWMRGYFMPALERLSAEIASTLDKRVKTYDKRNPGTLVGRQKSELDGLRMRETGVMSAQISASRTLEMLETLDSDWSSAASPALPLVVETNPLITPALMMGRIREAVVECNGALDGWFKLCRVPATQLMLIILVDPMKIASMVVFKSYTSKSLLKSCLKSQLEIVRKGTAEASGEW